MRETETVCVFIHARVCVCEGCYTLLYINKACNTLLQLFITLMTGDTRILPHCQCHMKQNNDRPDR